MTKFPVDVPIGKVIEAFERLEFQKDGADLVYLAAHLTVSHSHRRTGK